MKALEEILQPLLNNPFEIGFCTYFIDLDKKNRLKVYEVVKGQSMSYALNGHFNKYYSMAFNCQNSFLTNNIAPFGQNKSQNMQAFTAIHNFYGYCERNGKLQDLEGLPALSYRQDRHYGDRIEPNNFKAYLKDGKLHRMNGPAIIYTNGTKRWFLKGIELDEGNYWRRMLNFPEGIKFFAQTFANKE